MAHSRLELDWNTSKECQAETIKWSNQCHGADFIFRRWYSCC